VGPPLRLTRRGRTVITLLTALALWGLGSAVWMTATWASAAIGA
jgi:hypothetical protein